MLVGLSAEPSLGEACGKWDRAGFEGTLHARLRRGSDSLLTTSECGSRTLGGHFLRPASSPRPRGHSFSL